MNTVETEIVPATETLPEMERADSLAIWNGYRAEFEKLKESIVAVLAADPALPANAKIARANRLEIRRVRLAVETRRKELGEYHLRKTQAINAAAKELKELIEPYEDKLLEIEQHAERAEAERLKKLAADRTEALSKYTTVSAAVDYAALSDEEFDKMLADAKALHELRQAEAKRLEEIRIAKEKAEAEERERIRLENERLKKEAEEKEAALAAERKRVEDEKRAAEEKARKEREEIEAKARAEKEAAEAKARVEREEAEKKAAAERARLREIAEKERQEREALEAKVAAEKAAEEKKRKAEELARKKAAAAPDKEKLLVLAEIIRGHQVPEFSTHEGKSIGMEIAEKFESLANWIESEAADL
jgi:hypothetical protein